VSNAPAYRRLLNGGKLVVLGNGASAGLGLVLLLLLARTLSPADLAIVVAIIAVIDGGQMFLDASVNTGMINVAAREGTRDLPSGEVLRAGFWSKIFAGIVFGTVIFLVSKPMSTALVGDTSLRLPIMLAGGAAAVSGLYSFVLAVLTAHESFKKIALVSLVKNFLRIGVVAPFVLYQTPDPRAAAIGIAVITLAALAISAPMISWSFLRIKGPLLAPVRRLIGVNSWLFLAALAMLVGRLDVWLVGWLSSVEQAGLYAVATQLCVGVGILTQAVVTTFLPTVSRFESPVEMKDFLTKSARLAVPVLLIPLAVWPLSEPLINLVFGAEYARSADIFALLFAASVMTLVGAPLMLVLLSLGEARVVAAGSLLQMVLRLGIAAFIIPLAGGFGLAIADVASRLIAMALIGWFIFRVIRQKMTTETPDNSGDLTPHADA